MSDNVISVDAWDSKPMRNESRGDLSPTDILLPALDGADKLQSVAVFGVNKDGTLFAASSQPHTADVLLLIDRVRRRLMAQFNDDTFG